MNLSFSVKKLCVQLAKNVLTITELSRLSGVSRHTLTRLKSGTHELNTKIVGKLAKALNCEVEDLIED